MRSWVYRSKVVPVVACKVLKIDDLILTKKCLFNKVDLYYFIKKTFFLRKTSDVYKFSEILFVLLYFVMNCKFYISLKYIESNRVTSLGMPLFLINYLNFICLALDNPFIF